LSDEGLTGRISGAGGNGKVIVYTW
jgi:hypothetical protein